MGQSHQLTFLTLSSKATLSVNTRDLIVLNRRLLRRETSVPDKMSVQGKRNDRKEKNDRRGRSDLVEKLDLKENLKVMIVRMKLNDVHARVMLAKRRLQKIWQRSGDCSASNWNMKVKRKSSANQWKKAVKVVP